MVLIHWAVPARPAFSKGLLEKGLGRGLRQEERGGGGRGAGGRGDEKREGTGREVTGLGTLKAAL